MHKKQMYLYIGVDTHRLTHTAVIMNCWHEIIKSITIQNKPSGFTQLIDLVRTYEIVYSVTAIYGLEDTNGVGRALCHFLIDNNKLVEQRTSVINQLHMQLSYHYYSYSKFFSDIIGKTALAFWHSYPSSKYLENVSIEELGQFLRKESHYFFNDSKAKTLLDFIKEDKDILSHDETRCFLIKSYVEDIRYKQKEISTIDELLQQCIDNLGVNLQSFNGIDLITSAQLLSEIGDINRFKNSAKLARYSGIAPVTYSSGSKEKNFRNQRGNRKLNSIFFYIALGQLTTHRNTGTPRNPILYEYYHKKVSEGKTKSQAIVCVSRRLVNIVYNMLKYKKDYSI